MCPTCTAQLSALGNVLLPFIGITAAILIVKFEKRIKKFFKKK